MLAVDSTTVFPFVFEKHKCLQNQFKLMSLDVLP